MDEAVTRSSSSGRHPCSLPIAERLQAFHGAVAEAVDVVVVIDVSLALLEAAHEHTEVRVHVLLWAVVCAKARAAAGASLL